MEQAAHYLIIAVEFVFAVVMSVIVTKVIHVAIVSMYLPALNENRRFSLILEIVIGLPMTWVVFWVAIWHEPIFWGVAFVFVLAVFGWVRISRFGTPVN